jgi:hypothetical protein
MVYAAQPWGDNYAYKGFSDYLTLFGYMLWAISPYFMLAIIFHGFRHHPSASLVALVGTVLIVLASAALLIDAIFVHIDAQGGLIFLFLPIPQWLAALFLGLICLIVYKVIKKKS